jgi:AmiR/NasT family two-component response regulator
VLAEQLQGALSSRVVIEQAKGVLAHTKGVSIDTAFQLMRDYARSHRMGISKVAARIVDRSLDLDA